MLNRVREALAAILAVGLTAATCCPERVDAQTPSPESIARQVQDRDIGRDSRVTMRMRLFDRRGRSRERAMTLTTLR